MRQEVAARSLQLAVSVEPGLARKLEAVEGSEVSGLAATLVGPRQDRLTLQQVRSRLGELQ